MPRWRTPLMILVVLLTLFLAWAVWAGSPAHANLFWWVLGSGGGPARSQGGVTVNSSLGQPAIGVSTSPGGRTVLEAGYWPSEQVWRVYLPSVLRGD